MSNVSEIKKTIYCMIPLLRQGCAPQWAAGLKGFHDKIEQDPHGTVSDILAVFGGMGSLNDIVLYRDGLLLAKETSEFHLLSLKLYDLCHE